MCKWSYSQLYAGEWSLWACIQSNVMRQKRTDISVLYHHHSNTYGIHCHIDVICKCHIGITAGFTDMFTFPYSVIHCSLNSKFSITQRAVGSSQTLHT